MKPESPRFVPSSKDQLAVLVDDLVDRLLQNRDRLDEMNIEADKHIECLTRHALQPDQLDKESQRIFVRFLFDMTKDIMKEVYSVEKEDQNPPWMRQKKSDLWHPQCSCQHRRVADTGEASSSGRIQS